MEWQRKQAKLLARAVRTGEADALARAQRVLGARADERFQLSDAQHVVAVECGFGSWPELVRAERVEREYDSGLAYRPGEPVRVVVRRRGRRYLVSDAGRAVALAAPRGDWLEHARCLVSDELWLNVSRQGVVFVPAVEGGLDLVALRQRVAEASLALYQELLELE